MVNLNSKNNKIKDNWIKTNDNDDYALNEELKDSNKNDKNNDGEKWKTNNVKIKIWKTTVSINKTNNSFKKTFDKVDKFLSVKWYNLLVTFTELID